MTQEDPLARKLATLTATDVYDGRALRLGPAGDQAALSYVLQAIDDTMLMRDAVFSVGDSHVTLRISGKRLLAVIAASNDLEPSSALLGQTLDMNAHEALAMTAALLERLVTKTGTLTLDRQAVADGAAGTGNGVGVQTLAAAWETEPAVAPDDPIEVFLAGWLARAVAYIEVEADAVVEADGDDVTIDALMQADETRWPAFKTAHGKIADQTAPQLFVLSGLMPGGGMLVAAEFSDRRYLALIPLDAIEAVTAAWADIVK